MIEKKSTNIIFEHYKNKLKETDVKSITPEQEIAFKEAFYHAKQSQEAENLFNWGTAAAKPFESAAFWQLIVPVYKEMLKILEGKLGAEHSNVAMTLNNLAGLYRHMGYYEKALPLYQRALDIREKAFGPDHSDVATTLNNLAGLYRRIGDYKQALPLYQRALDIGEKVLGPQHPSVAAIRNNLAALYDDMGD